MPGDFSNIRIDGILYRGGTNKVREIRELLVGMERLGFESDEKVTPKTKTPKTPKRKSISGKQGIFGKKKKKKKK